MYIYIYVLCDWGVVFVPVFLKTIVWTEFQSQSYYCDQFHWHPTWFLRSTWGDGEVPCLLLRMRRLRRSSPMVCWPRWAKSQTSSQSWIPLRMGKTRAVSRSPLFKQELKPALLLVSHSDICLRHHSWSNLRDTHTFSVYPGRFADPPKCPGRLKPWRWSSLQPRPPMTRLRLHGRPWDLLSGMRRILVKIDVHHLVMVGQYHWYHFRIKPMNDDRRNQISTFLFFPSDPNFRPKSTQIQRKHTAIHTWRFGPIFLNMYWVVRSGMWTGWTNWCETPWRSF